MCNIEENCVECMLINYSEFTLEGADKLHLGMEKKALVFILKGYIISA